MKVPRSDIMRKILFTIDQHPSSIYDIQYSISELSDPRRTRLPKLLKSMEDDELVISALQPGPLGPYRRMYELGPKSQEYLNESLRDAIETILHFYNVYRRENHEVLHNLEKEPERVQARGCVLFAAIPYLMVDDLKEIRDVLATLESVSIAIVGTDEILNKTGIDFLHMGNDITSINAQDKSIAEIRLRGVPPQDDLPMALAECKRVLARNGMLRITYPFVLFDGSENSGFVTFFKKTIMTLFSDLGIAESEMLQGLIKKHFSRNGVYETELGQVVFWGIKS